MKTRAREDQSIIGYLLGTSSELEQSQLETRYFREPHFYEQMLALEEELICDYLNAVLTPAERRQFERHFLATPRRRRKFESTRKLLSFIADQGTPQSNAAPAPEPSGLLTALMAALTRWVNGFFMPRLSFLWTLASVAALAGGVWMLSVQVAAYRHKVETQETQQVAAKKANPKARPKPRAEAAKPRNPLADVAPDQLQASLDEPPALLASLGGNSASVVGVTLRASRLRAAGAIQQIAVPAGTATLSLRMLLGNSAPAPFTGFNAVLKTFDGQEIARRQNLSPQVAKSDKSLTLEVPASKLRTGRYVVTLTGLTASRETKPAEEYFVQINRD